FTVTGQATNTYNVLGLDSATVCTYKVAAIGDGITYSNSLLSAPSASFAISAGLLAVHNPTISNQIRNIGKTVFVPELGEIEVYNLQGVRLIQAQNVNRVSTNLKTGLYLVRFTNQKGQMYSNKLILQ
ncbi:T9SS type A sorting domain-containing protein, partial [bacterium]|nr:T9SS type A sorting domain-containing protein [bacterium]